MLGTAEVCALVLVLSLENIRLAARARIEFAGDGIVDLIITNGFLTVAVVTTQVLHFE